MATDVSTGFGSSFKMGNPVTLIELTKIVEWPNLPSFSSDLIDTTHYKTAGGFKTYRGGPLKDSPEVDFVMDVELGSTADAACRAALADGATRPFEMLLPLDDTDPNPDMWKVTGNLVVRNYVRSNPMEDIRKATLTVKWSGAATEVKQPKTV